jgi:hypothetical protein
VDRGGDRIHVELPRAAVGGLKKAPVEELLRRIARDYAQLQQENQELLQERSGADAWPDEPTGASQAAAGVAGPAEAPGPARGEGTANWSATPSDSHREGVSHPEPAQPHGGQTGNLELAGAVLAIARRMAHETRESTRVECELMIKKTRARAMRLERELEQTHAMIAVERAELEELDALRRELREQMRLSLHALLQTLLVERSGDPATLEWSGIAPVTGEDAPFEKRKRRKRNRKPRA